MSDMLNERLPALPPVPGARPTFPLVQAPSMRRSMTSDDMEAQFRHTVEHDDEATAQLAERIARLGPASGRPGGLKRYTTPWCEDEHTSLVGGM